MQYLLTLLGTNTKAKLFDDNNSYDTFETLTALSRLVNLPPNRNCVIDGPNTQGSDVNQKIIEGLLKVIEWTSSEKEGEKATIVINAHSRGAVCAIVLSTLINSLKEQSSTAEKEQSSTAKNETLGEFLQRIDSSAKSNTRLTNSKLHRAELTKINVAKSSKSLRSTELVLNLIDPVPGGSYFGTFDGLRWHDGRMYKIPPIVTDILNITMEDEHTICFTGIVPEKILPLNLPGNHATPMGNLRTQAREKNTIERIEQAALPVQMMTIFLILEKMTEQGITLHESKTWTEQFIKSPPNSLREQFFSKLKAFSIANMQEKISLYCELFNHILENWDTLKKLADYTYLGDYSAVGKVAAGHPFKSLMHRFLNNGKKSPRPLHDGHAGDKSGVNDQLITIQTENGTPKYYVNPFHIVVNILKDLDDQGKIVKNIDILCDLFSLNNDQSKVAETALILLFEKYAGLIPEHSKLKLCELAMSHKDTFPYEMKRTTENVLKRDRYGYLICFTFITNTQDREAMKQKLGFMLDITTSNESSLVGKLLDSFCQAIKTTPIDDLNNSELFSKIDSLNAVHARIKQYELLEPSLECKIESAIAGFQAELTRRRDLFVSLTQEGNNGTKSEPSEPTQHNTPPNAQAITPVPRPPLNDKDNKANFFRVNKKLCLGMSIGAASITAGLWPVLVVACHLPGANLVCLPILIITAMLATISSCIKEEKLPTLVSL